MGGLWRNDSRRQYHPNPIRKAWGAPRGQRARHVIEGNKVNVGDPNGSSKEVSTDKNKIEEDEMVVGSQMDHSTDEASNDGRGKDPR